MCVNTTLIVILMSFCFHKQCSKVMKEIEREEGGREREKVLAHGPKWVVLVACNVWEVGQPSRWWYCATKSILHARQTTAQAAHCNKNTTCILPQRSKCIACVSPTTKHTSLTGFCFQTFVFVVLFLLLGLMSYKGCWGCGSLSHVPNLREKAPLIKEYLSTRVVSWFFFWKPMWAIRVLNCKLFLWDETIV